MCPKSSLSGRVPWSPTFFNRHLHVCLIWTPSTLCAVYCILTIEDEVSNVWLTGRGMVQKRGSGFQPGSSLTPNLLLIFIYNIWTNPQRHLFPPRKPYLVSLHILCLILQMLTIVLLCQICHHDEDSLLHTPSPHQAGEMIQVSQLHSPVLHNHKSYLYLIEILKIWQKLVKTQILMLSESMSILGLNTFY